MTQEPLTLKDFITVTEKEKKKIEDWMLQTYGYPNEHPVDIMILILYKIHQLEKKVAIIQEQTKTHWAK
jgi:hypothetical protein